MSRLYYHIKIEEEKYDEKGNLCQEWNESLPHWKEISEWFPKEWNQIDMIATMSDEIREHIVSMDMKCLLVRNELMARITIEFKQGYRLTQKRRNIVWEDLDGQMSDGFGEYMDRQQIPNAPKGYCIRL